MVLILRCRAQLLVGEYFLAREIMQSQILDVEEYKSTDQLRFDTHITYIPRSQ
jgi:hypothetical protein